MLHEDLEEEKEVKVLERIQSEIAFVLSVHSFLQLHREKMTRSKGFEGRQDEGLKTGQGCQGVKGFQSQKLNGLGKISHG